MYLYRITLCVAAAATALAACSAASAPTDEASLKTATAEAIPGIDVASIEISNAERGPAKWTWQARAGATTYSCDADDKMRLPSCSIVA